MTSNTSESEALHLLADEFALWAAEDRQVRLFLRDDDAVSDTAALRKLSTMCQNNSAPLLLAAIPKYSDKSLARLVKKTSLFTPAVHGYAHVSHSPTSEKPCELDHFRPLEIVLEEMSKAREILSVLFDRDISSLLVPPWNRIHDEVLPHIAGSGFSGISAHGWMNGPPLVPTVNVHIDIMHWSGGVVGRSREWIYRELCINLETARKSGWKPIGILTHHLVHDDQAWDSLDAIFEVTKTVDAKWIEADSLLAEWQS